ncbi:hypothetical protein K435DRAFT_775196, partial [Dendrothele bispora CBS 962.96]
PDSSLDRRLVLSIFTVDNVQRQLATAPNPYLCHLRTPHCSMSACVGIQRLPFWVAIFKLLSPSRYARRVWGLLRWYWFLLLHFRRLFSSGIWPPLSARCALLSSA